uniref:Caffeoyl-CoA O-methyltransferase n=1 Tax=Salix viminalis TaxID=40686 RepID=A0A6N2M3J1_SALVM
MALPPKGVLQSEALKKYIYETSAYPGEHEHLKGLREATEKKYGTLSEIAIPVDEGRFLSMLMRIMNPKRTLEIGVFTGYSLLSTALALPKSEFAISADQGRFLSMLMKIMNPKRTLELGATLSFPLHSALHSESQITAIDIDREAYEFDYIIKIKFIQGDGISVLNEMLNNDTQPEFDYAFVDADKDNYKNYHEQLMKLVKIGGIIAYDNTLWYGMVAKEEDKVPENMRATRIDIMEFNELISSDPRIESSQVSIGDGVTLCRRLR